MADQPRPTKISGEEANRLLPSMLRIAERMKERGRDVVFAAQVRISGAYEVD